MIFFHCFSQKGTVQPVKPGPFFLLCALFILSSAGTGLSADIAAPTNAADRRYFEEFTKQPRNINKVKEPHLMRIFPMIGLSSQKSEAVFLFVRQRQGIDSLDDLLSVPGLGTDDLVLLKQVFFVPSASTNLGPEPSFEDSLETAVNEETESEDDPVRADLEQLADERLDLNTASPAELARLPWLTPFNIYNIVEYRKQKPFRKVEDLLSVQGLDEETVRNLSPFVTANVADPSTVIARVEAERKRSRPVTGEFSFRAVSALPPVKEHYDSVLQPSSAGFKSSVKLALFDKFKAGVVIEQDKGERSAWDLFKYFASAERMGFLKKAIWGYFRVTAGQGLTLSDQGPSKGTAASSIRVGTTTALKEDLSSYETRWFHGPAVLFSAGPAEGFLFYSFLSQDGTIEQSSSGKVIPSFSPDGDGLHDTAAGLEKKHAFIRQSFGGRFAWTFSLPQPVRSLKTGLTAYRTVFPYPVVTDGSAYKRFAFQGRALNAFGMDWDLVLANTAWFGEVSTCLRPDPVGYVPSSRDKNLVPGFGVYSGLLFQSGAWKTSLSFRSYQDRWTSLDAMPFSEYSGASGETGLYCGQEVRIGKKTKVFASCDVFSSSWRRYDETIPPFGSEFSGGAEHSFADRTVLSGQIKAERKLVRWTAASGSSNVMTLADNDRRIRLELKIPAGREATFRFRTEYGRTEIPEIGKDYGSFLAFADAAWTPLTGTKIQCRLIGFDTVYEAGVWEYETDIPSYMSSPSLLGRGGRFYVLFSRTIIPKNLSFHLKTAVTRYFRKTEEAAIRSEDGTITSSDAAERTAGSVRYELRCQVLSKF
jgi:hypothetical protein